MRRAPLACVLLLLVPALLAGCAAPDDGGARTTTPTSGGAKAPGHALGASTLRAEGASITEVAYGGTANGTSRWRLADTVDGLAHHRALILYGARVDEGEGILLAVPEGPEMTIEGALAYTAVTVSLDAQTRHRLGAQNARAASLPTAGMSEELRANGWHEDEFFSQPVDLRADGPVTLRGARIVLITDGSAYELGESARVASFDAAKATAQLTRVAPAAPIDLEVTTRRAHLAVVNATGSLRFDEGAVDAAPGALVTLAQGSRVRLAPADGGARVELEGAAYQAIVEDGPVFRSRLELRLAERSVDLSAQTPGREVAFELVALDPDTDPVLSAVRIEGAPNGTVRLPGYTPMTEQLVASFGEDPVAFAFVSPALPFVAFLDAFMMVFDMFLGPAPITQTLEAGTTFSSRLSVGMAEDGAPYAARIVIEGNFPTASGTLRVE